MSKSDATYPENSIHDDQRILKTSIPRALSRRLPSWLKRGGSRLFWLWYDLRDFIAELTGWLPSHSLRLLIYRYILRMQVGKKSSIHLRCRMYRPPGIVIGKHSVINREVLLDGRLALNIGDNVSISEGVAVFTLEHDPQSTTFANRGASVHIGNFVFIGARAIILPGVHLHEGAVIGAGAVVTNDVPPFTIVGGVPARIIGQRRQDLDYTLNYRKFLG